MKAWYIVACMLAISTLALHAEEGKEKDIEALRAKVRANGGAWFGQGAGGRMGKYDPSNTVFDVTPRQHLIQSTMYTVGLGVDLDEAGSRAKLDALSYGLDRRSVTSVPIGAIDNLGGNWGSKAIKVEDYFALTPEQTKAVTTLRDEFKAQEAQLAEEIFKQQLEQAQKVIALRKSFEQKANDILTGDDKKTKETLDTFMTDTIKKNAEMLKQALDAFKPKDDKQPWMEANEARITLTEKILPNILATEAKLLELAPTGTKAKVQEIIDAQVKAREQQKEQEKQMQEQRKKWEEQQKNGGQPVPPPQKPADKAPGSF